MWGESARRRLILADLDVSELSMLASPNLDTHHIVGTPSGQALRRRAAVCRAVARLPIGRALSVLVAVVVLAAGACGEVSPSPPEAGASGDEYAVIRAVDGDTIDVRPASGGERIRVRLIGVDTPESKDPRRPVECFAREAAEFTSRLEGKLVRLELDVERLDRYGRTLAYVYLLDGTFFNLLLVEEGYAQPYTVPPNIRYTDRFVEAGRRAREAGRGLWGRCRS